ncbi:hypothetical protein P3342_003701 [Pyrenophora teres f. teres]|uniref:Rad51-like C-terminal domain-containing protein n=1 Tax=Pyrenophora teres f. teres TaxID=97479 RepID=A0A6S6VHD1_9PLEO|nr:hypothetical protein P3342_003701 [Pyrenophora teres f. teres]CAE7013009.1 hypothetical protein PTTW11_02437 [Pyrenophora teres f. teres]
MATTAATPVTSSKPAEPLLASQLISDEELDDLVHNVFHANISKSKNKTNRLKTDVKSVDDALGGGLESAIVVCVSGEAAAGASEICRTFLVSSLLQHANSTTAVIDTTGNFDVLRLYTLIVAKLSSHVGGIPESLRHLLDPEKGVGVDEVAAMVLDRVKIMRVFDFEGVKEAVCEIEAGLERVEDEEVQRKNVVNPIGGEGGKTTRPEEKESVKVEKPKRTYVADSEDEEDYEEDEMLFDTETTATTTPAPPVQTATSNITPSKPSDQQRSTIKFILIDNFAQVINPLLKKDYIQANALSSTFLASLNALTYKHNLHTLLANPIIPPRLPSPTRLPATNAPPPRQRQEPPPPPSVFASNTAVPALMGVLGRYTDVEVLVGKMPRRKGDAKLFYSESGRKRGVATVGVLEVVKDRVEGRSGAWAVFREAERGIGDVVGG